MRKIIALFIALFTPSLQARLEKNIIVPIGRPTSHKKKDYRDERAHHIMQAHKHTGKLRGGNLRFTPDSGPVISHTTYVQPVAQKQQPDPFEEKRSMVRARSIASTKAIDQEIALCRNTRQEKRERALQQSKKQAVFSVKKYELSSDGKKLYRGIEQEEHRYDVRLRSGFDVTPRHSTFGATAGVCYGNQFQHTLYEEFVDIVNEAGGMHYATEHRELRDITANIAEFSCVGTNYVAEGFVKEALVISNFCWSMLDCCAAAGEGVVQGFKNTGYMFVQPVQTVQHLGHAAAHAGRCLSKVLKIMITEQDFCIRDPEEFGRVWKYRVGKIQTVLVAIKDKLLTTPIRDTVKGIATIGTEMVLMNELAAATGQFLTGARNKALQLAESCEREAEVVLAVTAQGIPLEVRVAEEATMHFMEEVGQRAATSASAMHLSIDQFIARIKQIVNLEPDLERLRKTFDMTRKGFGQMANKYIKLAYEHYLGPEFTTTKKGALDLKGFHHDLNNVLEKSGLVELTNKVINKNGFYTADVWCCGTRAPDKTFFPAHWPREKVISKIVEAYDNFIAAGARNYTLRPDGKYLVKSLTNDGVNIQMIITKSGHVATAHPVI